jgi:hypothetical protein
LIIRCEDQQTERRTKKAAKAAIEAYPIFCSLLGLLLYSDESANNPVLNGARIECFSFLLLILLKENLSKIKSKTKQRTIIDEAHSLYIHSMINHTGQQLRETRWKIHTINNTNHKPQQAINIGIYREMKVKQVKRKYVHHPELIEKILPLKSSSDNHYQRTKMRSNTLNL